MTDDVDVLVIGAGVAGLSVALGLAATRRVLVVDRAPGGDGGSTRWAQGGIAAAVDADDDPVAHAADTAVAGVDLCEPRALDCLVEEGPQRVADLIAAGAKFDRLADGRLSTTLEGGHHRRRVVHAGGDATGAEVARVLGMAAHDAGTSWLHDATVTALTVAAGRVTGATVTVAGVARTVTARAVVLATGGIGHAYRATTNPAGVTGDGLALALLAGAALTDVEFVQFHPTALFTGATAGQLPLVSEALRGEGAVLRDDAGRALMAGRHPLADLAPRDVVAREIHAVMTAADRPHVWLDARGVPEVNRRFPTIVAACNAIGVDPAVDLVPVAPAAHFLCGGVATDRWGRTDVPGLYAVGEVASTGVHGANRLASNSLLEGLVFGRRVATRLTLDLPGSRPTDSPDTSGPTGGGVALQPSPAVATVARDVLSTHAGVVRDAAGLAAAARELGAHRGTDPAWLVASSVIAAATARTESRGCHHRADHPATDDVWRRRVRVRLDAGGTPVADAR